MKTRLIAAMIAIALSNVACAELPGIDLGATAPSARLAPAPIAAAAHAPLPDAVIPSPLPTAAAAPKALPGSVGHAPLPDPVLPTPPAPPICNFPDLIPAMLSPPMLHILMTRVDDADFPIKTWDHFKPEISDALHLAEAKAANTYCKAAPAPPKPKK